MATQTPLTQAAEALKKGDRAEARRLLDELVLKEPDNAQAWMQLFSTAEDPLVKYDCLKHVARIRPNDAHAKEKLHKYQAGPEYHSAKAAHHASALLAEKKDAKARKRKEGWEKFTSFFSKIVDTIFPSGV
jgi:hypothetical protein